MIPFLSNAHNYSGNSLSIYHFLSDLQNQYFKPISSFSWNSLTAHYNYFPRVYFQKIVLKKAFWKLEYPEFQEIIHTKNSFLFWNNFIQTKNLPQYVNLVQGDNLLLLDLKNILAQNILLETIKKHKIVILEEFIFDFNQDFCPNQVLFSVTNANH